MSELPSLTDLFEGLPVPVSALVRIDNAALGRPLRELKLSSRLLRNVCDKLDLSKHKGELWSQFHGISYETKVAGHLADYTGAGIATIGHVAEFTEAQWRDVPGLGAKSFAELVTRLAAHGVQLGAMPLRDEEIWNDPTSEAKCPCVRHGYGREGKPLGTIVACRLRDKVYLGPLLSLVRCERIWCVTRSRKELIDAVTAKLRYRMYSLRHAGEPGNIHPAAMRRG